MPACPALCLHVWVATWPMFPRLRFWEDGVRCDKESRRCHRSCCRREGALSWLGFAGHREGRLEFDCAGGRFAYTLPVGVLRYYMLAVASHRPSDGRSLCACAFGSASSCCACECTYGRTCGARAHAGPSMPRCKHFAHTPPTHAH